MSIDPTEFRRIVEDSIRSLEKRYGSTALEQMQPVVLRKEVEETLNSFGPALSGMPRDAARAEIEARVAGLGLLDRLLAEPSISDILINGTNNIYVERNGKLEEISLRFERESELMTIVSRIARRMGKEIDPSIPMIDVRLTDGSRANIVLPPLAVDGPLISIRRFNQMVSKGEDLVRRGALSPEMLDFFSLAVRGKRNILVSGGTGAGKTTILNVLSGFIPENERIVTIEDAAELRLRQKHVARLETKAGIGGKGEVSSRDLFRNCLRMRPDRIIVGEVRGNEVLDMLQAMNTGHEGSMTTLHANTPRDALLRIEALIRIAGIELSESAISQSLSRAFHLIVQLTRMPDGRRVVQSVNEIVGREGNVITMQELFVFHSQGTDEKGRVVGQFRTTGVRPQFYDKIKKNL